MRIRFGLRWQIVLVVGLFVASLLMLLSSSLTALWLPDREEQTRQQMIDASREMAQGAERMLRELVQAKKKPPKGWKQRLTDISNRVLADRVGVEGGFYLANGWNEFAGHAFPNDPNATETTEPLSPDPPPKEKAPILAQCRDCLTLEVGAPPIVSIRDVPPSRVLIVTEPIGLARPAPLATWVMIRLNSPEHLAADLRRSRAAAGLAWAGIALALLLTINLGRYLRTERRQRDRLREELRRSEHLAALGKLLAGVAHEVRNPLAAIRSTVQLWQRLPEHARDPRAMEAILQGVDRLNGLVSRLLFFARAGHEERRPVDVNAVVQETLALVRAQAESQGVALQTELDAALPPVSGSPQALQQVVLNLATNALQAMPSGGTLRCRTRALTAPPGVELCVSDTGAGIAAADRKHLFEPFWTTRPEGTGLGLALCREIVQQHGGRIELDQQPGWGAVFRVSLPLGDKSEPRP